MKRVMWLVPAILCIMVCSAAHAQDTPAWELYGGYSYVKADIHHTNFHLNGGMGTLTQNVNSWFGARVETGFFTGAESGRNVTAQTITYGPVFATHRYDRMTPFLDVQFGAIHGSRGYLGISESAFKFAMAPGVGVDFKLNERTAVRVQADYVMTRFVGLRQDNLKGSIGLVVRFGKK